MIRTYLPQELKYDIPVEKILRGDILLLSCKALEHARKQFLFVLFV
jgi:hypothetical protein